MKRKEEDAVKRIRRGVRRNRLRTVVGERI